MSILAVDVGGTKVVCAQVESLGDGRLTVHAAARFPSREHLGLDDIVRAYLNENKFTPVAVSVGVAGPVEGGKARVTNLPWTVDAAALEAHVRAPTFLLNDLEAHASGLGDCAPEHLITINAGEERAGNRALIAAGTGLGEAILFFDGRHHRASASEGGHCAFSPVTEDDDGLLRFLRVKHGFHVSWERVVSGLDGFRNMLDYLVAVKGAAPGKALTAATAGQQDIGAAIIEAAESGDAVAVTILRWFVRLYGAEAGNLALKSLAIGGLFVGGGIAPRILPYLQYGEFSAAMTAKGRFAPLLSKIPVRVVTDPDLALIGAARFALTALSMGRTR